VKKALQEEIARRFDAGETQAEIARSLGLTPQTIRYHLDRAGVVARVYGRTEMVGGKKRCQRCGKLKTLGAFSTGRTTVCRVCYGFGNIIA